MARKRKGLPINGIVLVDKPAGMSSNAVVQKVKHLFNAQKAGHTGALDPLATGMLPVCLGEATKFSQYSLNADKAYLTRAILGIRTDTSDADGEIIETKSVNVSEAMLKEKLKAFIGKIKQTPSMYSALKYNGRPLYYYARKGQQVPRPERDISVYDILIKDFFETRLDLQITCSKGTYIRTIIDDLGQALDCGAHVSELRRLWIEGFKTQSMYTLDELSERLDDKSILLPLDIHLSFISKLMLSNVESDAFIHGMQITLDKQYKNGDELRVYDTESNKMLGIGKIVEDNKLQPKRVIVYE